MSSWQYRSDCGAQGTPNHWQENGSRVSEDTGKDTVNSFATFKQYPVYVYRSPKLESKANPVQVRSLIHGDSLSVLNFIFLFRSITLAKQPNLKANGSKTNLIEYCSSNYSIWVSKEMSSHTLNPILSMDKFLEIQQCFLLEMAHHTRAAWVVPVNGLPVHFRYPHQPQRRSTTTGWTHGPSVNHW